MPASPKDDSIGATTGSTVINSAEFAKKALELHGIIAVSQLQRLHDTLVSTEGDLDFRLVGSSEQGKSRLGLYVNGSLQLSCQRCLESFSFDLNIASSFIVVPDESAIPVIEENDPDMGNDDDYLVADARLQVIDLIEDEILLALPLAPKHDSELCAGTELNELKKPNPFAVLKEWKAGKTQN
jgi:uncharacterized protein